MKTCATCKVEKPETEFNWRWKSLGIRPYDAKTYSDLILSSSWNEASFYQKLKMGLEFLPVLE
jgi:hypothetical protein